MIRWCLFFSKIISDRSCKFVASTMQQSQDARLDKGTDSRLSFPFPINSAWIWAGPQSLQINDLRDFCTLLCMSCFWRSGNPISFLSTGCSKHLSVIIVYYAVFELHTPWPALMQKFSVWQIPFTYRLEAWKALLPLHWPAVAAGSIDNGGDKTCEPNLSVDAGWQGDRHTVKEKLFLQMFGKLAYRFVRVHFSRPMVKPWTRPWRAWVYSRLLDVDLFERKLEVAFKAAFVDSEMRSRPRFSARPQHNSYIFKKYFL